MHDHGILRRTMKTEVYGIGSDGNAVSVELIHRKVHLRRCYTEKKGAIFMPQTRADSSWWYQIVAVSDDCRYFTKDHVGGFVILTDNEIIGNVTALPNAERIVSEDWLINHTPATVFTNEEHGDA